MKTYHLSPIMTRIVTIILMTEMHIYMNVTECLALTML